MPVDADFLMQRLMAGGMSRMQAAAVVGNLQREISAQPDPRWQALQQPAGQQDKVGGQSPPEQQVGARNLYGSGAGRQAPIADRAVPPEASRETSRQPTRDDIARIITPARPRGIRGGLQSIGQSLATALYPRSSGASPAPPGGGAAAGGGTPALSTPQPSFTFPDGAVPIPTARPATAPGLMSSAPDAATSLPGARMGALADLSAYRDEGWYG